MKLLLVLLFAAFAAFAAVPQPLDEQAFTAAMKTMLPTQGSLRKNIEAKNADGAKADAAKLEAIFKTSEEFWTERKADDAVEWSKQGKAGAAEIGKLAGAGEWDKIPDAQKKVGSTCSACHTAHREGSRESGYKIK
jgi:cytochrome c556